MHIIINISLYALYLYDKILTKLEEISVMGIEHVAFKRGKKTIGCCHILDILLISTITVAIMYLKAAFDNILRLHL